MYKPLMEFDAPAAVVDLRFLASDIRRFVRDHGNEIPNAIHQTTAIATMIDVVADRIERRES